VCGSQKASKYQLTVQPLARNDENEYAGRARRILNTRITFDPVGESIWILIFAGPRADG